MIGAASIPNTEYIAFEPCTQTYNGLLKLGQWLKTLSPNFNYKIYHQPYEDNTLDEKFDIILTSPPYYDIERYSDEYTNSLNRYTSYEHWLTGFYYPLISSSIEKLKDNACFILNIGDRQYDLSEKLLQYCDTNNIECSRISDYLHGQGAKKEKFFALSKNKMFFTKSTLF